MEGRVSGPERFLSTGRYSKKWLAAVFGLEDERYWHNIHGSIHS